MPPELPAEDAAELAHIRALHQQQQQADRQARRQQAEKDARKDGVLPVGEAVVRWKAAVEAAWYAGDPPPAVKPHLDAITTALNRAGEAIRAYPPARATWEQLDHEGTFQQCSSPFIQPYQQRPGGAVAWPEGERRACRLGYEHARRVVDMLLQGGDPTSAIELLLSTPELGHWTTYLNALLLGLIDDIPLVSCVPSTPSAPACAEVSNPPAKVKAQTEEIETVSINSARETTEHAEPEDEPGLSFLPGAIAYCGKQEPLSGKPLQILEALNGSRWKRLTQQALIKQVWQDTSPSEENVRSTISHARTALVNLLKKAGVKRPGDPIPVVDRGTGRTAWALLIPEKSKR
ncbi:MAG TPA: hypothetical protein VKE74_23050 [Gemmataceae bacterium]|nr:hypothetical protein [Gemmataceae bacterium]